ncbi:kinesin-like protein Klp8 [Ascosphaera pollenicola]|nr:kinesin-like protein Klp8 [Ascosphaera pollenicola]
MDDPADRPVALAEIIDNGYHFTVYMELHHEFFAELTARLLLLFWRPLIWVYQWPEYYDALVDMLIDTATTIVYGLLTSRYGRTTHFNESTTVFGHVGAGSSTRNEPRAVLVQDEWDAIR